MFMKLSVIIISFKSDQLIKKILKNIPKKYNKKIKKKSGRKLFPANPSMNVSKFLNIIKK